MEENGFTLKKKKKEAKSWWYPTETIIDAKYADDLGLIANTSAQIESQLHSLEQTTKDIGFYIK